MPEVTPSTAVPVVDEQHPWLGLLPFTEKARRFFFGRETEIGEILDRIRENTLTVLFGQSGLGKTSLLGAGVAPRLEEASYAAVLLRLDYTPAAPPLLEQTRTAFCRTLPAGAWPEDAPSLSLWEIWHRLPGLLPEGSPPPVLLFDQFEEIFTLGRQDPRREHEGAEWLEQMADLLQNRPPRALEDRFAENRRLARAYDFRRAPVRIVLSLREDYLSHLEGWKTRLPLLVQNRMSLHLLNGPQALEAVLGPASLGENPLVSREVAASIVRTVAREEEETPLAHIKAVPPLLSLLCEQLNAARLSAGAAVIDAAMVSGRSTDILQRFYEESFAGFAPEHREAIRALIEDPPMVTEGGYRNSFVRDDAEAQLARQGVPDPRGVFDALIHRRLITVEEHSGLQRLEITHDVLVPLVVRSRKERQDRMAKELAERKLAEEAARTRRRRLLTAAMGLLTLLALAGALYGFLSARKASRSAREAAAQRDEARYNEGLGWMLRAEVAEERSKRYPETLLYAAKAIGFEGFGRPAAADEPVRYLRQDRNPAAFARAQKWIAERPAYRPVWASALRNSSASGLSFSPTGRWLALAGEDGQVSLWDLISGQQTALRPASAGPVHDVVFDPVEKTLAIATSEGIELWDLEKRARASAHPGAATALAWSPGGELLAAADPAGNIVLWRGEQRSEIASRLKTPATRLAFSPENSVIAAAYPGKGVRLFFPHAGTAANAWLEHKGEATAVAVSPDGLHLAIGSADGSLALWSVADARELGRVPAELRHRGAVLDLVFREDGRQLASASADGTIKLWETSTEIPTNLATLCGATGAVSRVGYAPGGDLLAGAGADGAARLWSVTGQPETQPNLLRYLTARFYAFDPATQQALWSGGAGFVDIPRQSLLGRWQQNGSGGVAGYLLAHSAWAGAARLGADPAALAKALLADAEKAAQENRWHRVDLRLRQLAGVAVPDAAAYIQKLTAARAAAMARAGQKFTNGEGEPMIWCPPTGPGGFLMGSPKSEKGRYDFETRHKVVLTTGFWLGQYDVTQAEWAAVMGSNPSTFVSSGPKAPVENISWFEAVDFCRRLTDRERARGTLPPGFEYALPTEAQWEYACRAGTSTAYSFGDDPAELYKYGNFNNSKNSTTPAGSYLPNKWGFYDMHGNVWQWCQDAFDLESGDYGADDVTDPVGLEGTRRVYRGGGWSGTARFCRSAGRYAGRPSGRVSDLGLRPAVVPSRPVTVNGNERGSAR